MTRLDIGTIVRDISLSGHSCPNCGETLNFTKDKSDSEGKLFPTMKAEHCGQTFSASVREVFIDVSKPNAEQVAAIASKLKEGEDMSKKFRNKGAEAVREEAEKIKREESGEKEPEKSPETVEELVKFQQDQESKKKGEGKPKSEDKKAEPKETNKSEVKEDKPESGMDVKNLKLELDRPEKKKF